MANRKQIEDAVEQTVSIVTRASQPYATEVRAAAMRALGPMVLSEFLNDIEEAALRPVPDSETS